MCNATNQPPSLSRETATKQATTPVHPPLHHLRESTARSSPNNTFHSTFSQYFLVFLKKKASTRPAPDRQSILPPHINPLSPEVLLTNTHTITTHKHTTKYATSSPTNKQHHIRYCTVTELYILFYSYETNYSLIIIDTFFLLTSE